SISLPFNICTKDTMTVTSPMWMATNSSLALRLLYKNVVFGPVKKTSTKGGILVNMELVLLSHIQKSRFFILLSANVLHSILANFAMFLWKVHIFVISYISHHLLVICSHFYLYSFFISVVDMVVQSRRSHLSMRYPMYREQSTIQKCYIRPHYYQKSKRNKNVMKDSMHRQSRNSLKNFKNPKNRSYTNSFALNYAVS
uniref:Uncharacterized protein n=1 Tax=Parascaris univalens TaxID=6257 RepID=A0A915AZT9_PARUN